MTLTLTLKIPDQPKVGNIQRQESLRVLYVDNNGQDKKDLWNKAKYKKYKKGFGKKTVTSTDDHWERLCRNALQQASKPKVNLLFSGLYTIHYPIPNNDLSTFY